MKIALLLAYDGTGFRGWAKQHGIRTVQGVLEEHLAHLLKAPVTTAVAGRTDAGVHAAGQVTSFESLAGTDPAWLMRRLNRWLAPEIAVRAAAAVPDGFDARHSARRRMYRYAIYLGAAPDPFLDRFALHAEGPLDVAGMRRGARALIGEHDFAAFCRRGQLGTVRRVRSIAIARPASGRLSVRLSGASFCQQMVRAVVGTLLDVGNGARPASDVARILASRDRALAGPVAPARGLTLAEVGYARDPFRAASQGAG